MPSQRDIDRLRRSRIQKANGDARGANDPPPEDEGLWAFEAGKPDRWETVDGKHKGKGPIAIIPGGEGDASSGEKRDGVRDCDPYLFEAEDDCVSSAEGSTNADSIDATDNF